MQRPFRTEIAILLAIVALAAALRGPGLARKAFWVDEIQAVERSQSLQQAVQYCALNHEPPLRYVVLHYMTRGRPLELFARLPSFLFALATIPLLWLLLRNGCSRRSDEADPPLRSGYCDFVFGENQNSGPTMRESPPPHVGGYSGAEEGRPPYVAGYRGGDEGRPPYVGGYRHMALLAALLLALSPWHIFHSQDARMYAVMMFLWTLSLLLFFGAIEKPSQPLWWPALALVHAANFYLSYITVFVLLGEALTLAGWLALRKRRERHNFALKPYAVGALIFAGFFGMAVSFWINPLGAVFGRYTAIRAAHLPAATRATYEFLREQWPAEFDARFLLQVLDHLLAPGPLGRLAALAGLIAGLHWLSRRNPLFVAVAALSFAAAVLAILVTSARHFAAPRYIYHVLLFSIVAFAAAIAAGIEALTARVKESARRQAETVALIAAGLILAGLLAPALARHVRSEKQDWRGAVRFLEQYAQPGDTILTGLWGTHQAVMHYSPADFAQRFTVRNCLSAETLWQETRHTTAGATLWYITWGHIPSELGRVLQPLMQTVAVLEGLQGTIVIFRRQSQTPDPPTKGASSL